MKPNDSRLISKAVVINIIIYLSNKIIYFPTAYDPHRAIKDHGIDVIINNEISITFRSHIMHLYGYYLLTRRVITFWCAFSTCFVSSSGWRKVALQFSIEQMKYSLDWSAGFAGKVDTGLLGLLVMGPLNPPFLLMSTFKYT